VSFERFSTSDIYMYEHVGGFIECCGCLFSDWPDGGDYFPQFKTPYEAMLHLAVHEMAGHDIGNADRRIVKEYPDLHVKIQPYVKTPEQEISDEAFWKSLKDEQPHPPQTFRDRSNGE
jgi:hypothetical protein